MESDKEGWDAKQHEMNCPQISITNHIHICPGMDTDFNNKSRVKQGLLVENTVFFEDVEANSDRYD